MSEVRKCTKCKLEFPADLKYFDRCKGGKYNLTSRCKTCLKKYRESRNFEPIEEGIRVCSTCSVEKPLTKKFFGIKRSNSSGLDARCKQCHRDYNNNRYKRNKKKIRKKQEEYYQKNKDLFMTNSLRWRTENKERKAAMDKVYKKNNEERVRENQKKWLRKNRKVINAKIAQRRLDDPEFRIVSNLRTRMRKALKGIGKADSTLSLLSCSTEFLREYIENQFDDWMTWDNYGQYDPNGERTWVLDHIRPIASFSNLLVDSQQRECFHYTNLQPLCSLENAEKGSKYPLDS
jgi:hypothetical protein